MIIVGCDFHPSYQQNAILDPPGSGVVGRTVYSWISQRVSAPLPPEAQASGEGGCGAQAGGTPLLDVPHPEGLPGGPLIESSLMGSMVGQAKPFI